jgi:uncharacterized protein (DUF1330 family)
VSEPTPERKGYWVVHIDVTDTDTYRVYQEFVRPFLAANGGRFVIRGGEQSVVEGSVRPRTVVVEFPSLAEARRVYHSPEYQTGMRERLASSTADFAIVEGFES